MSPSILTPGGIISATRSYFGSLGSLTSFVVGFLGDTYALGKFNGSDASSLGVSSCIGTNACLVHGFFICDVDAPVFGGAMDFFDFSTLQLTRLFVLFECSKNYDPFSFPSSSFIDFANCFIPLHTKIHSPI
jgi:hypothetical protein